MEPLATHATFDDFLKIDLRVGRIERAEPFPKARKPAYKLWIDFGELGVKQSSAQITKRYQLSDLPGKLVIAVVNFPPKQVADFMSEVLVLGAVSSDQEVVLISPNQDVEPGLRIL